MKQKRGFLKVYLVSVLLVALIGLADAGLTYLNINPAFYVRIVSFVLFLFFFFNVFALAVFRRHNLERIVYVLPIYHLVSYIIFLCLAIYLAISGFSPDWLSIALIGLQATSSIFELSFSIYLLKKIDFHPVP